MKKRPSVNKHAVDVDSGGERENDTTNTIKPKAEDKAAKFRSFRTRTLSTFAMIGAFIGIIYLGHVPLMFLVLTLQYLMVRELFQLAADSNHERNIPGFRKKQWYFFFVATFYLYTRFIKKNLLVEITSSRFLAKLFMSCLKFHTFIAYMMYVAGFVMFVLSLKRGEYLYQFGQYAWTHMILLVIFVPSSFFVSSIFEGLIWFLLPSFLIIANDIFAYLAGFFMGRTPLIKLSPKKTWEGFIGGFIGTVVFAYYLSFFMSKFEWMTCPRKDLSLGPLHCPPSDLYAPRTYTQDDILGMLPDVTHEAFSLLAPHLPPSFLQLVDVRFIFTTEPIRVHAMVLAIFASIIAPFGGFFASGFKRAFKMKDFGHTIPGHGGVTDRFDCQVMMAMFSFVYYWNVVYTHELSAASVLQDAMRLDSNQQQELYKMLGNLIGANTSSGTCS